jgi:K+-transporting ATPase KdpF subunit
MSITTIAAVAIAAVLLVYLAIALLYPEKF